MKIALFVICCVQLFGANAQTFCLENFGSEWGVYGIINKNIPDKNSIVKDSIYEFPNIDSLFFANDTITFDKTQFYSEFKYLSLNCTDSTYTVVNRLEIELEVAIQKKELTYMDGWLGGDDGNGIWSLLGNTLAFKPNRGNTWFRFKIEQIGTKETNKTIIYGPNGDYRTSIRLIRIE